MAQFVLPFPVWRPASGLRGTGLNWLAFCELYKTLVFGTPLHSPIPEQGHLPLKQLLTNSVNRTDNLDAPNKGNPTGTPCIQALNRKM